MTRRANGEGTIRKRADGRWEGRLHFRVPSGELKEKAVYGRTQKECREKFDLLKGEVAKGLISTERQTVGGALQSFLHDTGLAALPRLVHRHPHLSDCPCTPTEQVRRYPYLRLVALGRSSPVAILNYTDGGGQKVKVALRVGG